MESNNLDRMYCIHPKQREQQRPRVRRTAAQWQSYQHMILYRHTTLDFCSLFFRYCPKAIFKSPLFNIFYDIIHTNHKQDNCIIIYFIISLIKSEIIKPPAVIKRTVLVYNHLSIDSKFVADHSRPSNQPTTQKSKYSAGGTKNTCKI